MIEEICHILRYGLAPNEITSVVYGCFIECDALTLNLKALRLCNLIDDNLTGMEWDYILQILKTNHRSIASHNLWSPKANNSKGNTNTLSVLHSKINNLADQVSGKNSLQ